MHPLVAADLSVDASANLVGSLLSDGRCGRGLIGFGRSDLDGKDIDPLGLLVENRLSILEATALLPANKILRVTVSTLSTAVGLVNFGFHFNRDGGAVTSLAGPEPFTKWIVSETGVRHFPSYSIAKFYQRLYE